MIKDNKKPKKELERLSNKTLQEQLYNELLSNIKSGLFKPGDMITSELKLSEQYSISRVTVRNSIQQLVDDGYLIKRKGKGTFVKPKVYTEEVYKGSSFTDNCTNRNAVPSTEIVSCKMITGDSEILSAMNTFDSQIIELVRIRKVDDTPCIVEIDYLPNHFTFLLDIDLTDQSLLKLITKHTGVVPAIFTDQFTIQEATKEYASFLDCKEKTPLLLVTQSVNTNTHEVIYVNKQFILTSKYIYVKSS